MDVFIRHLADDFLNGFPCIQRIGKQLAPAPCVICPNEKPFVALRIEFVVLNDDVAHVHQVRNRELQGDGIGRQGLGLRHVDLEALIDRFPPIRDRICIRRMALQLAGDFLDERIGPDKHIHVNVPDPHRHHRLGVNDVQDRLTHPCRGGSEQLPQVYCFGYARPVCRNKVFRKIDGFLDLIRPDNVSLVPEVKRVFDEVIEHQPGNIHVPLNVL